MNLTGNIILDIFSIIILIILSTHLLRHAHNLTLSYNLYICIIFVTIFMLAVDILSRFDGNPGTIFPMLNIAGNFLVFMFGLTLPSLWLLYAHEKIYHDAARLQRLVLPLILVNAANALILILTQFNGWYYTIDDQNVYHRGPLFWFPVAATIVLLVIVFVMVGLNRKAIDRKHYYPLLIFIVPPLAGILLQLLFYGTSFMLNSIVLSLLIVFLYIQNQDVYTDYLTGINNRKKLDLYMADKIRSCSAQRTFSAILLDIDDFKNINDTFGHNTGDEALEAAAILLSTCLRANDFIARFGGDEFLIVLDISGSKHLDATIDRIRENVRQYNESCRKPYKLEFSMGYAVYDYDANMKLNEFQKLLDTLMYEAKRAGKQAPPTLP